MPIDCKILSEISYFNLFNLVAFAHRKRYKRWRCCSFFMRKTLILQTHVTSTVNLHRTICDLNDILLPAYALVTCTVPVRVCAGRATRWALTRFIVYCVRVTAEDIYYVLNGGPYPSMEKRSHTEVQCWT